MSIAVLAAFVPKYDDAHAEAINVASRYGVAKFWLILHGTLAELLIEKPPTDYRPYATSVEKFDGSSWSRAR
jgi:hypothetical protein